MASLRYDGSSGIYSVRFRYGGKPFTRSLDTQEPERAEAARARVEETLMRLKRGWLQLPRDAEPGVFIVSDGQLLGKPEIIAVAEPEVLQLGELFTSYAEGLPKGSKAANTLSTERIHRDHLLRGLDTRRLGISSPPHGIRVG